MSVERFIAAGQRHGYRIDLGAGDLLEVTVEQRGADVSVRLHDPSGCLFGEVDSPNGPRGPERLFAVTETEGGYVLEVERPSQYGSDPGSYGLEVARRVPTERDLLRAKASRLRATSGSTEEELEALKEAVSLWEQTGETYLEATTRLEIAGSHWIRGSYEEALMAFEEADLRISSIDATDLEPALLSAWGDALRASGDLSPAVQRKLEQAVAVAQNLGNRWQEAAAMINLGMLFRDRRKAWEALGFFDRGRMRFEVLGDPGQTAQALHNRGELLNWLGREEEALEDLNSAFELRRQAGSPAEIAETLRELGWVEKWLGDRERAERRIEKALEIYREQGSRLGEAVCLDRLGRIYLETGRAEAAREAHEQAVDGFREMGDRPGEAHGLINLGRALRDLGGLAEAQVRFEEALRLFEEQRDPSGLAQALAERAWIRRLEGDLHGALGDLEGALSRLEDIRESAQSPSFRANYLATVHERFEQAVDLLMELEAREPGEGWLVRAFEMAEQGRARTLLDLVSDLDAERRRQEVPDFVMRDRDGLRQALRTWDKKVRLLEARNAPAEEIDATRRHLSNLILEWERRLGTAFREGAAGTSMASRSFSAIRETLSLDADTSLLLFSLGERRSFVWWLGDEGLNARELPPREEIRAATESALEDVRRPASLFPDNEDRLRGLDRLGELLLGSLPEGALSRRLVVIPDGVLHRIPFSALRLEGRHLVQDHQVVRVPSASVLVTLRERKHEHVDPSRLLAVMADPVFQRDDPRLPGVPADEARVPLETPSIVEDLLRLPASGLEADAIADLVAPTCRWTARGFKASREPVEQGRLAGFHVIHLATHAMLDDKRPETSGIALSGFDQQGRPREGYLYAFEIAELDLTADLVVLSACQTGLGHEIRGEGLVGLTQSFLEAGADRVLVSLWDIDDAATAELMGHFYRGLLRDRRSPAEALRGAQERLRRGGVWSEPYHWAGFTLVGDWGELPSTLFTPSCLHP